MLRRLATSAHALTALASATLVSCSSSAPTPNERVGEIHQNDTWTDGTKLTGLIQIYEGATVTVEPGAKITCTDAVQIQIGGSFVIKAGSKRTQITCNHWRGFLVATDGKVDITGLDTGNADVGIETSTGAGAVTITDSSITSTPRPFLARKNSTITATKVHASTPTTLGPDEISVSEIFGTLTAKYLTYEANTNEGVMVQNGGSADIQDSTMTGKNGFDLISCYGCKSLSVSYTTMAGAHCGLHFAPAHDDPKVYPGSLAIDHVTSDTNLFGITIYAASDAGPHSVKSSNFDGDANSWLDYQGPHGPIDFEGNYVTGHVNIIQTDTPTFNTPATAPIADAKPR
jgi:hypothetical protein